MNLILIHTASLSALFFYLVSFFYPNNFTIARVSLGKVPSLKSGVTILSILSHLIALISIIFGRLVIFGKEDQFVLDYLPLPVLPIMISSFILLFSYFCSAKGSAFNSKILFYLGYLLFFFSSFSLHSELTQVENNISYVGMNPILGVHIILSIGSQVLTYFILSLGFVIIFLNNLLVSKKLTIPKDSPALIPSIKLLESIEFTALFLVVGSLISGLLVVRNMESVYFDYKLKFVFTSLFLLLLIGTLFFRYTKKISAIKISNFTTVLWLFLLICQTLFKFVLPNKVL